jgi:hypothetical protein
VDGCTRNPARCIDELVARSLPRQQVQFYVVIDGGESVQ